MGTGFQSGATIKIGAVACGGVIFNSSTSLNCTTGVSASAGSFDVVVTNTDLQTGTLTAGFAYHAPPTINAAGVVPAAGLTAGGTAVTISGTGFAAGATVLFGVAACTGITVVNATSITCTTPANAAGAVGVTVTNTDALTITKANAYTYNANPTVTGVVPPAGPPGGGTAVTITGTGFVATPTVTIGGVSATSVVFVNSFTLTAVTGANAVGLVGVTVTNPALNSGTGNNLFTYTNNPPPTILSVSPNTGSLNGATFITITGTNFQAGASAVIGPSPACLGMNVVSATSMTCTTRATVAGTYDIDVTNGDGQQGVGSGLFTYLADPTVTQVSPNSGPWAGGLSVTVSGTGFVSGSTMTLGGTPCTSVSVGSSSSLTCTTGGHVAGAVQAKITEPNGQTGALNNACTYNPAPTAFAVTPSFGTTGGGTTLNIYGTGFIASATITVGGTPCTLPTAVSVNNMTCITPSMSAGIYDVVVTNPDTQTATVPKAFTYGSSVAFTQLAGLAGPNQPLGFSDGTSANARFNVPNYAVASGNFLYVSTTGNSVIRKIDIGLGTVSTFAGSASTAGCLDGTGTAAQFTTPSGLAIDSTYLYVADYGCHVIRRINLTTQVVATIAGQLATPGETDNTGGFARLTNPLGVSRLGTTLYFTEGNDTVRSMSTTSFVVTTLAGVGGTPGSGDGTGSGATFRAPAGIDNDGTYLYVADTGNHTIRIVTIGTWVVSTYAGGAGSAGYVDNTGTSAKFSSPIGVYYNSGNLYVADSGNSAIRQMTTGGAVVTTFAGGSAVGYVDGAGSSAKFSTTNAIGSDGVYLYVTDAGNQAIRRVLLSSKVVSTLEGVTPINTAVDATGTAARFYKARNIASDGTYVYVADCGNSVIRQVTIATGATTTLAGTAGNSGTVDGTGSSARFTCPTGIAYDGTYLWIADSGDHTIRQLTLSTASVATFAGTAGTPGIANGTGTAASFNGPTGIISTGPNLYVADKGNHAIRKITVPGAVVTTFSGTIGTSGSTNGPVLFNSPSNLAFDATNLYVADTGNHVVRTLSWAANGGAASTVGTAVSTGYIDSIGAAARFQNTVSIATDGVNVYVGDNVNNALRQIVIANSSVTTFIGQPGSIASGDVNADIPNAYVTDPQGLALYAGKLFYSDSTNVKAIRTGPLGHQRFTTGGYD